MEDKKIQIIIGSTRPGRIGKQVAQWVESQAKDLNGITTEIIDLEEVNLPFLDEFKHPSMNQYSNDHTKAWSEKIKQGSAYIWVTPEYNAGYPASMKNAIDYLYNEWGNKPVLIVSYGVGGGGSANHQLTEVATRLKMRVAEPTIQLTIAPEMRNEDTSLKNTESDFTKYAEDTKSALKNLEELINS